jgi:hypothetical protein
MRSRGTVAVTFDREDAVPPPMLEERRVHRWPLAGPAAFPLPYRQLSDGTMCEPDADELGLLTMSLYALAELASRQRSAGHDRKPGGRGGPGPRAGRRCHRTADLPRARRGGRARRLTRLAPACGSC